jgi:glycerol dehydrogenase-like iron-containing ADH family enzyme
VEALRKKKKQDETQFIIKIGGKTSLDFENILFVTLSLGVLSPTIPSFSGMRKVKKFY